MARYSNARMRGHEAEMANAYLRGLSVGDGDNPYNKIEYRRAWDRGRAARASTEQLNREIKELSELVDFHRQAAETARGNLKRAFTSKARVAGVVLEIAFERQRQVSEESVKDSTDDTYENSELIKAAMCYLSLSVRPDYDRSQKPKLWPWSAGWWKPKDDRRNLIRAAALIVAEIERLDRKPRSLLGVLHRSLLRGSPEYRAAFTNDKKSEILL